MWLIERARPATSSDPLIDARSLMKPLSTTSRAKRSSCRSCRVSTSATRCPSSTTAKPNSSTSATIGASWVGVNRWVAARGVTDTRIVPAIAAECSASRSVSSRSGSRFCTLASHHRPSAPISSTATAIPALTSANCLDRLFDDSAAHQRISLLLIAAPTRRRRGRAPSAATASRQRARRAMRRTRASHPCIGSRACGTCLRVIVRRASHSHRPVCA